jgi:hypothetical protein
MVQRRTELGAKMGQALLAFALLLAAQKVPGKLVERTLAGSVVMFPLTSVATFWPPAVNP